MSNHTLITFFFKHLTFNNAEGRSVKKNKAEARTAMPAPNAPGFFLLTWLQTEGKRKALPMPWVFLLLPGYKRSSPTGLTRTSACRYAVVNIISRNGWTWAWTKTYVLRPPQRMLSFPRRPFFSPWKNVSSASECFSQTPLPVKQSTGHRIYQFTKEF